MKDFDNTVDELYQLCRRAQKETNATVVFAIANYKSGTAMSVSIRDGKRTGKADDYRRYSIVDGGYQEEENTVKAREHLNRLLIEKPCPYCEEVNHGE